MKHFKNSLVAFVCLLALVVVTTLFIPSLAEATKSSAAPSSLPLNVNVVNTSDNPVPVTGTVSVGNAIDTKVLIPSTAFSVASPGFPGFNLVSGPNNAGTNFAITSLTVTNLSSITGQVTLLGLSGNSCTDTANAVTKPGPSIFVPGEQSVHLSFPQPFVIPSGAGAVSCLDVYGSNGVTFDYSVVGYRF